jgi:ribonuclease Z
MTRKRKFGLTLAALLLIAGIVFYANRTELAERLFARAVERTVGVDQAALLPDGLHVYVCGSGSPLPDAERAGPCLGVLAGKDAFVFDAGSGSIRKLVRMGFPMGRLRGAYLTHLHSDHIDGLGELMLQAWIGGSRGTPLPISGPAGTDKVVGGLMQAYELDKGYRVAHHGAEFARPGGFGGAVTILSLPDDQRSAVVYEANGVKITLTRAIHDPIKPAFAFRVDYKGRSVAISGDTVYSPDFVATAKGADVMFHEALNPELIGMVRAALAKHGRTDAAKIMGDIRGYHASPEDAARAARDSGVRALVFYHLVPSVPAGFMERAFVGNAGDVFTGEMRVSRDGLLVSLPANGKAITFNQLL